MMQLSEILPFAFGQIINMFFIASTDASSEWFGLLLTSWTIMAGSHGCYGTVPLPQSLRVTLVPELVD